MQEIQNHSSSFPTTRGGSKGFMSEVRNNSKNIQIASSDANQNTSDVPVETRSVPTKVLPAANTYANDTPAATFSADMGSGYYGQSVGVSPMPPTPNPATDNPSSEASKDNPTPPSQILAALYHSSRRSRHESPMPSVTQPKPASITTFGSRSGFPPPPPLASASPKAEVTPFQSTPDSSAPLNDSWNTSMNSIAGFIQAPPLYNFNPARDESQTQGDQYCKEQSSEAPAQSQGNQFCNAPSGSQSVQGQVYNAQLSQVPHAACADESYLTPLLPAKPILSRSQFESFEFTPSTTMDRQLLDLANESSANMCMEQFSRFSTRPRSELEYSGGVYDTSFPPAAKRRKGVDISSETMTGFEQTPGSYKTNASYDTITFQASKSPLNNRVEESVQSLLALSKNKSPMTQEMIAQNEHQQEPITASSKREQDIIRRKVQRLLLIRHATRCNIPPPPSEPNKEGSRENLCPVTSHCAEGKRLASHIRKCKDVNCRYKWCLTTRDVLCHYRNCRDRKCQICGPVRAMHRSEQRDKERKETEAGKHKRARSENSVETIDDSEFLRV